MIRLNVEEDLVVGIDSREILKEIQCARQDWLVVGNVKKWGISPKFVGRKKKILIETRKEIYAKSPKMMISPSTLQSSGRDIPTVDNELGGVRLEGVLVDSGSSCNVIDRAKWEELREKKVKCV